MHTLGPSNQRLDRLSDTLCLINVKLAKGLDPKDVDQGLKVLSRKLESSKHYLLVVVMIANRLSARCSIGFHAVSGTLRLQDAFRGSATVELARPQEGKICKNHHRCEGYRSRRCRAAAADADVIDVEAEEIDDRVPVTVRVSLGSEQARQLNLTRRATNSSKVHSVYVPHFIVGCT